MQIKNYHRRLSSPEERLWMLLIKATALHHFIGPSTLDESNELVELKCALGKKKLLSLSSCFNHMEHIVLGRQKTYLVIQYIEKNTVDVVAGDPQNPLNALTLLDVCQQVADVALTIKRIRLESETLPFPPTLDQILQTNFGYRPHQRSKVCWIQVWLGE
jgi:hypothetical protein